jgi:hypothetical protein
MEIAQKKLSSYIVWELCLSRRQIATSSIQQPRSLAGFSHADWRKNRSRLKVEGANNDCIGLSGGFHELHLRIEKVLDGRVVDDKDERFCEKALNSLDEQRQVSAVESFVIRADLCQPMAVGVCNLDFPRSVHESARKFLVPKSAVSSLRKRRDRDRG